MRISTGWEVGYAEEWVAFIRRGLGGVHRFGGSG
jgi:hypothetical protein